MSFSAFLKKIYVDEKQFLKLFYVKLYQNYWNKPEIYIRLIKNKDYQNIPKSFYRYTNNIC